MKELIQNGEIIFGSDGNAKPRRKRFLKDVKQGIVSQTIWKHEEVGHTQEAKQLLNKIFDGIPTFDTPKPLGFIKRCMKLTTSPKDIILDFFSGSATTAHAVLALNAEDGGNRKFICVQLPEPTRTKKADGTWDESEAYKAGFSTIAEIGKERIRRVIAQLKEEGTTNKEKATGGKKTVKIQAFQANEEAPSLGFERTDDQLTHNGGGYRTAA